MPKNPSHIAIFLRSLAGGGAEKVMVNLSRSFVEKGLKVDLVLTRTKSTYDSEVHPDVRVVDLQAPSLPTSIPKLTNYLKKEQPFALLSALHYPCEIALWAKRLAGVSTRIIVSEHNTLSVEAKRLPQLTARLTPIAAKLFYPWADGIIAVSQGVATDLANVTKIPQERIKVIYNPVVTPDIAEKAKEPVEHPWFASGQPPVILAVGRLIAQKDYPTLIRAFAKVLTEREAKLVILGRGQEREQLNKLVRELGIKNHVAWISFVANPYSYMRRAAVLALSSAWEGFGNVLVEAMASGTPVVSTNCPSGPAEILDNGKYGELVPVGDSEAMAKAILQVLAGNYKTVDSAWLQQFTLEYATQKYLEVLGVSETN